MPEVGTSDTFYIVDDASRAADFQGHFQGHLTWEEMPQQLLDDGGFFIFNAGWNQLDRALMVLVDIKICQLAIRF